MDLRGFDVRAALLCLLLLAAFEFGIARREAVWTIEPRSSGQVLEVLQHEVLDRAAPPAIIVLGSSRLRDAVVPGVLESELALDRRDVLNLAVTMGTPSDAQRLIDWNRGRFASVRCAIVGIEDWYLNDAIGPTARDRRYASLRERLHFGEHSLALLVGGLWHTNGANDVIRRYLRAGGRQGPPLEVLGDGRLRWHDNEAGSALSPADEAAQFFGRYSRADERFDRLAETAEFVRSVGGRVVFLQVPLHSAYRAWMREERPEVQRDLATMVDRLIRSEGQPGGTEALIWGDPPPDLRLGDAAFRDYGHLTDAAAGRFSRALADAIREHCADP